MWSASYHVTEETSRFILSTGCSSRTARSRTAASYQDATRAKNAHEFGIRHGQPLKAERPCDEKIWPYVAGLGCITVPTRTAKMKIPVKSDERTQRSAHAVGDLIDAVRRHEEAIRSQTTELEQLRAAVLKAAEREAADIIDVARGDIRLIVTDARRRLLELSGSVRLAVSPHADVPARGTEPPPNWQSEARREMLKTLREANAEFARLADDVTTGPPRDDRFAATDFPKLVPPLASEESPFDPNESPSTTPYESGDAPDQSAAASKRSGADCRATCCSTGARYQRIRSGVRGATRGGAVSAQQSQCVARRSSESAWRLSAAPAWWAQITINSRPSASD